MPNRDGLEVLKIFKVMNPDDKLTKFVLISANAHVSGKDEALNAGFCAMLTKPPRSNELLAILDNGVSELPDMNVVTNEYTRGRAPGELVDITTVQDPSGNE